MYSDLEPGQRMRGQSYFAHIEKEGEMQIPKNQGTFPKRRGVDDGKVRMTGVYRGTC